MAGWIHKIGAVTYRVTENPGRSPKVERWTLASRKTGRYHWVEVNPHFGAYVEVLKVYERLRRDGTADVS